jgi:hypothetical protein
MMVGEWGGGGSVIPSRQSIPLLRFRRGDRRGRLGGTEN